MAKVTEVGKLKVFELLLARTHLLKREQDEGERLLIHRIDDANRGRRDVDGSQHFDVFELMPSTFGRINILA